MEKPPAAYKGDGPYVFVCYAHDDAKRVYPEIRWLHEQGVNVWYDEGISPGENWTDELGEAIGRAERFLYYVTPASVASRHCRNEVHFAHNHQKSMLAVHLVPTTLPVGLELAIGANQAILKPELSEAAYHAKLLDVLHRPAIATANDRVAGTRPRRALKVTAFVAAAIALVAAAIVTYRFSDAGPAAAMFERSVSVEPFTPLSADPTSTTFAAGLTDEIGGRIAKYQELKVALPAQPKGPGSDTHRANYALAGVVQQTGPQLRVRAQLSRTWDRRVVWSDVFDGVPPDDVVAQTAIATKIGRFVRLQLVQDHQCETVRRQTRSAEAADAVCAAMAEAYRNNQGGAPDLQLILASAKRAIDLDPELPAAYRYLGLGYAGVRDWQHAAEAYGTALAKDRTDPLNWLARGRFAMDHDWNYDGADTDFREAIRLDPLHPQARHFHAALGYTALRRGDIDAALDHYRRAINLYDADARIYNEYAVALVCAGEYDAAIRAATAGLELVSAGTPNHFLLLANVANAQYLSGDLSSLKATASELLRTAPPLLRPMVAAVLMGMGDKNAARQLAGDVEKWPIPVAVAIYYAVAEDRDAAFEWLHRVIDARSAHDTIRADPRFAKLHSDPRWQEVLQHLERAEASSRRPTP